MKNVAGEYIPRISCLGDAFLPSGHPLRIHLGDILPENSVPFPVSREWDAVRNDMGKSHCHRQGAAAPAAPGASAPTRDTTTGTANPWRARLDSGTILLPEQERLAREGYSPFSALALRAFSMIWVGESKSSVLALPGATHSSRCLTTMPMFST